MNANLGVVLVAALLVAGTARAQAPQSPVQPQTQAGPQAQPSLSQPSLSQPPISPDPHIEVPAQPRDAAAACEVPAYLLSSESALPKVADALRAGKLTILVLGSRSSVIAGADGTLAYPGRLQAALRDKLPGIAVEVTLELQVKKTAEEVEPLVAKLAGERKPNLVIWQTGTVDAMRAVDPDDFRTAMDDGVTAMQAAGSDVVLLNLQYSPRTETMIAATTYLDNMRVVAQQQNIPLFDRFAIMRHWHEAGDFDLFSASRGVELARKVHDCLGKALSTFLIDAAHIKPGELGKPR